MNNTANQEIQMKCFSIISYIGDAKSNYMEALRYARNHDFDTAGKCLEDGRASFVKGHKVHAELIAAEAEGQSVPLSILLMHAEALLIDAEATHMNVNEFISLYKYNAERI